MQIPNCRRLIRLHRHWMGKKRSVFFFFQIHNAHSSQFRLGVRSDSLFLVHFFFLCCLRYRISIRINNHINGIWLYVQQSRYCCTHTHNVYWPDGGACVLAEPLERAFQFTEWIFSIVWRVCIYDMHLSSGLHQQRLRFYVSNAPKFIRSDDMLLRSWCIWISNVNMSICTMLYDTITGQPFLSSVLNCIYHNFSDIHAVDARTTEDGRVFIDICVQSKFIAFFVRQEFQAFCLVNGNRNRGPQQCITCDRLQRKINK